MEPTSPFFAGSSHVLLRPWHTNGRLRLYEAEYIRHRKPRIVLVAPPDALGDSRRAQVWLDRAKAAASLAHPYLLRLAAAGITDDGGAYAAYPMTPHRPARHLLEQSGPIGIGRACDVSLCVLSALHSAHASGFLHGAVGLETVLLAPTPDTLPPALILGLGPCAALEPIPTALSSPERLAGSPLTERGDVYSVAVLLVSLIAPNVTSGLRAWVEGATLPDALKDTLVSALDSDPSARQPSAKLLASELLTFADNPDLFQLRLDVPPAVDEPQCRIAIHPATTVRSEPAGFPLSDEPAREILRAAIVPLAPTLPQVRVPGGQASRPKQLRPAVHEPQASAPNSDSAGKRLEPTADSTPDSGVPTVLTRPKHWPRLRHAAAIVVAGVGIGLWYAWLSGLI